MWISYTEEETSGEKKARRAAAGKKRKTKKKKRPKMRQEETKTRPGFLSSFIYFLLSFLSFLFLTHGLIVFF